MSDWIKWGAIGAAVVIAIGAIGALFGGLNLSNLGSSITNIVNICSDAFSSARGLVNMFFPSWFLPVLTWLIGYVILKPFTVKLIMMTLGAVKVIFK